MTASPSPSQRTTAWVLLVEILLVGALVGWFLGVWLVLTTQLDALPPGSRSFQLAIYRTDDSLGWALAMALTACALLLLRRSRPVIMFAAITALVLILHWRYPILIDVQPATTILIALAAFWAAIATIRIWPIALGALASSALAILPLRAVYQNIQASAMVPTDASLSFATALAQALVITGIGLSAAILLRRSRALAHRLERSNEQLRSQREAVAAAAVVDERLRIARELHDVVAHHVTAMTVHAGAVRTIVAANPRAVDAPLQQIESSGREAVRELHRLLGFLRDGQAEERAPAPSLDDLPTLTTSFPTLRVDTQLAGDPSALSPMLSLSVYRIVQEALTNVVKHSTARSAVVRIDITDHVTVTVRDPGVASNTGNGTGHGTLGLRERAALHSGTLEAGPIPGGGWQVTAQLALGGGAHD